MIIGLAGYAGSGKDTVAKILVDDYGFQRRAFADKIRDMLYEINPMAGGEPIQIRVDADGWDKAKQHPEVRRLLQKLGVAARNHLNSNVWVMPVLNDLGTTHCVITDVRFENEAQAIISMGGELWRIERPGVGPVNNHISESELKDYTFDKLIINDGTFDDLKDKVLGHLQWQKHL